MSIPSRIASTARNLFRRSRVEAELDRELRGFVELLAAEKVRRGMGPDEAQRAALVEAGGVEQVKEAVRDARAGVALDTLLQDVRYGARWLRRSPGFTLAAVLALALGIGANTAIVSVLDAVLVRPLPYRDADRLVVLMHRGYNPVAPANFVDWRRQTRAFSDMAAADYWTPNLTGTDKPEKLYALKVTANMFALLGVPPALGRTFSTTDVLAPPPSEVVISHALWQRHFAGNPSAVGQAIQLDGNRYTVVGVMPRSFAFAPFWATHAELWVPNPIADRLQNRGGESLRIFARLGDGVTIDQARADVAVVTARLEQQFPGTNRDVRVQPLKEKVVGGVETALVVIMVAVACVLLIACANVAHMLLARAAARHRELAVRAALGATRWRLVRQLMIENVMLAFIGGAAGVVVAAWAIRFLVALGPDLIPRIGTVSLDGRVLVLTVGITILTGVVFGLIPALRASSLDLADAFKDGDRSSTEGVRRNKVRSALVASEFALALVLLIGAGLMMRSFAARRAIDPGFDPRDVMTMVVSVTGTKEADPALRAEFFGEVLRRVRALPEVAAAGAINHLPLAGDLWGFPFSIEGRARAKPGERPTAAYRVVLPGYFSAMRIPFVAGRDVGADDRGGAPGVVVINEWMAKKYWPGENAVGKRLTLDDLDKNPEWLTVIGVVNNPVRGDWAAPPDEEVYLPYLQNVSYLRGQGSHVAYLTIVARARRDPTSLGPAMRAVVASLDASVPVSELQSMTSVVASANAEPRFYVLLLGGFAAIALIMAAVGIYGVMSYAVSRRTHEIGVRIALGARPATVLGLVVRQGMSVALIGAAAGVTIAFALTRLMSGLLYGVRATDPFTFGVVTLVLLGVAFCATYLPARRATRIDPLAALRSD